MMRPAAAVRTLWNAHCDGWRAMRRQPAIPASAWTLGVFVLLVSGHSSAALPLALVGLTLVLADR
ncbi:hypothetical protein AB0912_15605 [Streptomyces sp. NPDC007084]|uniref:hypothetical protein n=1 Tax=Streptomyces sp. NPDC007084 TaxID=3154313 RepID=UPI003455A0FA